MRYTFSVSFGFTTAVAYVLFGTYSLLTIILLVNMLIAIMARSYEIIIVSCQLRIHGDGLLAARRGRRMEICAH